ncbi:MAG: hypothetical protein DHS20C18_46440 [Saprospiraceae bacterium]|nr:MAG: hypothetical protein DHS20C18_46440 [Saprospiraceae bacterium]
MKNWINISIILHITLFATSGVAQNLVPNGDFELGNGTSSPGCYDYYSGDGQCGTIPFFERSFIRCAKRFDDDLAYWMVAHLNIGAFQGAVGSPDWTESSLCFNAADTCEYKNQTRFVHMSAEKENIRTRLQKGGSLYKLKPGKRYRLNISVQPIREGSIRMFFSKWDEHWNSNSSNNEKWEAVNANIHFNNESSYNCDWLTISRDFTVPIGYQNLSNIILVLSEHKEKGVWTEVNVDDIQLFEIPTCPEKKYIQNFIHWNETNIYQANKDLIAGENVIVPPDIYNQIGEVVVKGNSKIIYRAGEQVDINTGFQTETGAYFDAQIHPCEENPCPRATEKQKEIVVCSGSPIQIGFQEDEKSTIFHQWSPASNLDNPQSANPYFTPPLGIGKITFQDRLNSICGYFPAVGMPPVAQGIENEVTVFYDSNPSGTPAITINNIDFNDYNFSYNINVNSHTEWVKVEILDVNANVVLHTKYFKRGIDFSCCNINSTYNNSLLSRCKDYQVRFSTKNYCFETIASEMRNWDIENSINLTLLPNTFSPDNDGINDNWCIEVEGADTYEIEIYNRWSTFKSASGRISNYRICLWDGKNNSGRFVRDGTYYFILKVRNDCGKEIIKTGNITKF